jgi:hypothetical protein
MSYNDRFWRCLLSPILTAALQCRPQHLTILVVPQLCVARRNVDSRSTVVSTHVGLSSPVRRINRHPNRSPSMEEATSYTR